MEWINIKDRLPGLDEKVLCLNYLGEMQVCSLEKRWATEPAIWYFTTSHIFIPTHWMPLPEAPK